MREEHVEHSNALHARMRERGTYLTGPLARYNLAFELRPLARDAAREAGLADTCHNPFQSIIVRSVELVQACDDALAIIAAYEPPDRPAVEVQPCHAVGHGVSEAPRGMLYHRYEIDEEGTILDARIVPPTSQNQLAIEEDLRAVVEHNLDLPDEQRGGQAGCRRACCQGPGGSAGAGLLARRGLVAPVRVGSVVSADTAAALPRWRLRPSPSRWCQVPTSHFGG